MPILNDSWIEEAANKGMITPFVNHQVNQGLISYGLSSHGYDARLADTFKIFLPHKNADTATVIDPKAFSPNVCLDHKGDTCVIPPNGFVLVYTLESFKMPRNVLSICVGKSTYARCGVIVNVTPLESESEGHVVIELSNTTPFPVKIYAFEGICQFLFFEANTPCRTSYKDRGGKYMHQEASVVLPTVTPRHPCTHKQNS